ncbi:MAG: dockerin type I domain-containing protein, partial [Planctomycetota bacterium]
NANKIHDSTVEVDGLLQFIGGFNSSLGGNGITNSRSDLDLTFGTRSIVDGHQLNNFGTANLLNGSTTNLDNSTLTNQTGAEMNLTNSTIQTADGVSVFTNQGTLNQINGSSTIDVATTNSGAIHVDQGSLGFTNLPLTNTGDTKIAAGATLSFSNGRHEVNSGGRITGQGLVSLGNSAVLNFDSGILSPGGMIETLNFNRGRVEFLNDSVFEIQISSVTGAPGTSWDFISSADTTLDFGEPNDSTGFEIKLSTIDSQGNPLALPGFDPNDAYVFEIATVGQIVNFDPSKVRVDTTCFQNSLTGKFSVTKSSDDRSLLVKYMQFDLGDVNQDGKISLLDISPFVAAITDEVFLAEADMNCDGAVDLLDVRLFVDNLAGQ